MSMLITGLTPMPVPHVPWLRDGSIAISLQGVLQILNMRIDYESGSWEFFSTTTGKLIFTAEKDDAKTPFDALREKGYFKPATFDAPARAFLKTYTPPSQQ